MVFTHTSPPLFLFFGVFLRGNFRAFYFRGDEVTKKAVTDLVTANQHEKPILIH